jgi:hypothetical protein
MGEDADQHLASCAECRGLAEELRLNSVALREMRVRPAMHWEWALAVAAIVVAIFVWRIPRVENLPVQPTRVAVAKEPASTAPLEAPKTHVRKVRRAGREPAPQPLRVKMFTSDPDVVIYWIVDRKEGSE